MSKIKKELVARIRLSASSIERGRNVAEEMRVRLTAFYNDRGKYDFDLKRMR